MGIISPEEVTSMIDSGWIVAGGAYTFSVDGKITTGITGGIPDNTDNSPFYPNSPTNPSDLSEGYQYYSASTAINGSVDGYYGDVKYCIVTFFPDTPPPVPGYCVWFMYLPGSESTPAEPPPASTFVLARLVNLKWTAADNDTNASQFYKNGIYNVTTTYAGGFNFARIIMTSDGGFIIYGGSEDNETVYTDVMVFRKDRTLKEIIANPTSGVPFNTIVGHLLPPRYNVIS